MNETSWMNEDYIHELVSAAENPQAENVDRILSKAAEGSGLEPSEAAVLVNIRERDQLERLYDTANKIKERIYGNRLVLFAPLYVSNHCSNNCMYCGFRIDNSELMRQTLSLKQVREEAQAILTQGHKRILMLMGEDERSCSVEYFLEAIDAAYQAKDGKGSSLRRINVEIAPLTGPQFRQLSGKKIGTYTVFQETYHKKTYELMHPSGRKNDYLWRLETMDRALDNGLHDVGIGALFGLYDYRFEVVSLLMHARHLDEAHGVGPHTISVPRIKPATNAPASQEIPNPVSDEDFKKIIAVLRCSVPYTGIILSTREAPELRDQLFSLGVSQISAGSKTAPGEYSDSNNCEEGSGQFSLNDTRSTGEVISSVIQKGYIPSFCTACYRRGRVGGDFMELAKPGLIKRHCLPNAITTLEEYLIDYADEDTRVKGEKLIKDSLADIGDEKIIIKTAEYLEKIKNGQRDLYF
ncbi:MAG: [FeFe] hydrogenase H-cluster radical SAM maturase HydG [Candidatus Altiarchaeota archaeon]